MPGHTRTETEATLVDFTSTSSETDVSSVGSSKSRTYVKELQLQKAAHEDDTRDQHELGERAWAPAPPQSSRSVCPALNSMANHGYIPRSGHEITLPKLVFGLRAAYNLTYVLAIVLALGGFLLIGVWPLTWRGWKKLELREVGRKMGESIHERRSQVSSQLLSLIAVGVEHNASLVHTDVPHYESHLPNWRPSPALASTLFPPSSPTVDEIAVAHARLARESASLAFQRAGDKSYTGLDAVHAEIARGEMAIILGVWREREDSPEGIPLAYLLPWLTEERLPVEWVRAGVQGKSRKRTGLLEVMRRSKMMKKEMDRVRAEEGVVKKRT